MSAHAHQGVVVACNFLNELRQQSGPESLGPSQLVSLDTAKKSASGTTVVTHLEIGFHRVCKHAQYSRRGLPPHACGHIPAFLGHLHIQTSGVFIAGRSDSNQLAIVL